MSDAIHDCRGLPVGSKISVILACGDFFIARIERERRRRKRLAISCALTDSCTSVRYTSAMRNTILSLALLSACTAPSAPADVSPASSSSTSPAVTESGDSSGTCMPHLSQLGDGKVACYCDALIVDPTECGCAFAVDSCECPNLPCAEISCEMPCAIVDNVCYCGDVVDDGDRCGVV